MNIEEFIRKNSIKATAEKVESNPNMENWEANHYRVTLTAGEQEFTTYFSKGFALKGEPTAEEVLECLAADSAGIEYAGTFEDWAAEFGYDQDSREAEKVYNACVKHAEKLRSFLGEEKYNELLYDTEK